MEAWKFDFIRRAAIAAEQANHAHPVMAACEAALESTYGTSDLALTDKNLFGMKQHKHPIYGTHVLPTKEFEAPGVDIDGDGVKGEGWVTIDARWVSYPGWRECFQDRMATLERLRSVFPHYDAALKATDPTTYVMEVSATWASDPKRGQKVLDIYSQYYGQPGGVIVVPAE
jgi:flagellum-specific peptidoglycan hydrolase FlgJ